MHIWRIIKWGHAGRGRIKTAGKPIITANVQLATGRPAWRSGSYKGNTFFPFFFFFIKYYYSIARRRVYAAITQLCFLVLLDRAYCYSCHSVFSLRCSTVEVEEEVERGAGQFWQNGGRGLFFISFSASTPSLRPSSRSRGALASVFHRNCGRPCEDPTRRRGKTTQAKFSLWSPPPPACHLHPHPHPS